MQWVQGEAGTGLAMPGVSASAAGRGAGLGVRGVNIPEAGVGAASERNT